MKKISPPSNSVSILVLPPRGFANSLIDLQIADMCWKNSLKVRFELDSPRVHMVERDTELEVAVVHRLLSRSPHRLRHSALGIHRSRSVWLAES